VATALPPPLDTDVVRKFHFTREMIEGPIYRKYEKAIRKVWSVEQLDFTQDAADWNRIDDEQRRGLLGVTVRFLAGEQNVTDELVPMLAASHALKRFDWTVYLSTFLMEEAKHAEFFMRWHDRVVGVLEPEEVAQHFLVRGKTIDPSGRFEVRDVLHEALPYYGRRLMEATLGDVEAEIERAFVAFSAAYNSFVEGVLTMPSYEIVIDTTTSWDAFPTLREGFRLILMDEGRHITFGTHACKLLIEKDASYEEEVHRVFDAYRGNIVGLVEYQKAVPGLDLNKYQVMKVRHYRNRCREMGITPDETLVEQILDPSIDFVVGVEAG
jgi:ribonucleoside-diphosphate reductase beta chain